MALGITKTKLFPVYVMPGMWRVGYNLTCTDGGVEVINKDITVVYKTGYDLLLLQTQLQRLGQAEIDVYGSSNKIHNSVAYTTAIDTISLSS